MSKQTQAFVIAFTGVLVVFLLMNLIAAHIRSDCGLPAVFGMSACADDIVRLGFPLQFFEEGGIAFRSKFDGTALAGDVVIGLVMSLLAGYAERRRAG